ncbi:MAG: co-chaperone GroES [bacterium]|nr:co-chaperone GroES [bacterium]
MAKKVPVNPMPEYIVLQSEEAVAKTKSGIYLPDSSREKPKAAKVVAVGSAIKDIKVGEQVIYKNEFEATTVKVEDATFIIVFRMNVIATIS